MTAPPKKTLLLGLGNPLSGDDGFGPCVLERLAQDRIKPGPNNRIEITAADFTDYPARLRFARPTTKICVYDA
jgi:Ni,Fe-hydrogenase maturation factor